MKNHAIASPTIALIAVSVLLASSACGGRERKTPAGDETLFPLVGNTAGFVRCDTERLRDTLRRIELLNDDGSEWMSMHADILNAHLRDGTDVINDDLSPWAFEPGIGVFVFRCVGRSDDGYAVVVNEEKNMVKHLRAHANLIFDSVEEHVSRVIVGADFDLNPVRERPTDDAPVAPTTFDEREVPVVTELRGEWIRIKDIYSDRELGWIRWKKDDRFMIRMYYSI